jgi:hypothetical protein
VDGDLRAFGRDHDDDLKQVARRVWADEQPSVGIFAGILKRECMVDRVDDVWIGDAVLARRLVNLTRLL